MATINVRDLQTPIRQRYKDDPAAAQVRLKVRSTQADLGDPLQCAARADSTPEISWRSGAHPAVGGTGDVPCSGDLLLGALAACQETTRVTVPEDVRGERADRLLRSAEKYCVVLNTLRNGVPVEWAFSLKQA